MAVGAVAGAIGAYNSGKAEKYAAGVQGDVARRNAALEEERARDSLRRGRISEDNQRLQETQMIGSQRAAFAARGLSLDEGSPLAILETTQHMSDVDIGTIRDNTAKEAWALRQSAANYRQTAQMWDYRADHANPKTNAYLSLLGSGGNVASSWYKYSNSGA